MLEFNLEKFGNAEYAEAARIMDAMQKGIPSNFVMDDVRLGFIPNEGDVFLVNSDGVLLGECDGNMAVFHESDCGSVRGFFLNILDDYKIVDGGLRAWIEVLNEYYKEVLPISTTDGVWIDKGDTLYTVQPTSNGSTLEVLEFQNDGNLDHTLDYSSTEYYAWLNYANDNGVWLPKGTTKDEWEVAVKAVYINRKNCN